MYKNRGNIGIDDILLFRDFVLFSLGNCIDFVFIRICIIR